MDALVTTQWLATRLGEMTCVVLDASMHLPAAERDARAEFAAGHIPTARFLDLDSFTDPDSRVPKALPTDAQFAERLTALGVKSGDRVVLYDDSEIRSAARAWFIFARHGFANVAILDGGLAKWRAEDRPLEQGTTETEPGGVTTGALSRDVRSKADMRANCIHRGEQVVDARDAARFAGEAGSGSEGHIPGARNLPFARLFDKDGTWHSPQKIRALFAEAGVDLSRPVITTCNSGMTATVLAFALYLIGHEDVALYDGSWMEWGADRTTPKETGPAR